MLGDGSARRRRLAARIALLVALASLLLSLAIDISPSLQGVFGIRAESLFWLIAAGFIGVAGWLRRETLARLRAEAGLASGSSTWFVVLGAVLAVLSFVAVYLVGRHT